MSKKLKMLMLLLVLLPFGQVSCLLYQPNQNIGQFMGFANSIISISTALLLAAIVRAILQDFRIGECVEMIAVLFFGMLVGYAIKQSEFVARELAYFGWNLSIETLALFYVPLLTFQIAFSIELYTFLKTLPQIIIIGVFGALINTLFTGINMWFVLNDAWTIQEALYFGIICYPIYPFHTIHLLNRLGTRTRHIKTLLEGETMVGLTTVTIYGTFLLYQPQPSETAQETWTNYGYIVLKNIAAVFCGFVAGALGRFCLRRICTDPVDYAFTTLTCSFLSYLVSWFLTGCGNFSVAITGVTMAFERQALAKKTNYFLKKFWKSLEHTFTIFFVMIFGITITLKFGSKATIKTYALTFITYLISSASRLITLYMLLPILNRFGYSITWKQMFLCFWAGIKNPLIVIQANEMLILGTHNYIIILYAVGVYTWTLLINGSTTHFFIDVLGISQESITKIINMKNCITTIKEARQKSLDVLKMDRQLADANWPMIQECTSLPEVYKRTPDVEDSSNYLLANKGPLCPDCLKDTIYEPTVKEFSEMTKEGRMRVLKAKKVFYSRHYEKGILTAEVYAHLTQCVEIAMDSKEAFVNIDPITRLFKKENFCTRWIKNRVHGIFRSETDYLKRPRIPWRRFCFNLVTHPYFDIVLYVIILINVTEIIFEMVYTPQPWEEQQFLYYRISVAVIFFFIYFFEFLIKIFAYSWIFICKHGLRTYFRSYWNCVDFVLLLVNVLDVTFCIFEAIRSENLLDESGNVAQVIKIFRVFRFFRLLRILKTYYPKIMEIFERRSDANREFAYAVGVGYLGADRDLLLLLDQMIDNVKIKNEIKARVETDRVTIVQYLGEMRRDRPWVPISVKTRQACRSLLIYMSDAIKELKINGWVDDTEFYKLNESLGLNYKALKNWGRVPMCSHRTLFGEIIWMGDESEVVKYLYDHVKMKKFKAGENVFSQGEISQGLYYLVKGLLTMTYEPDEETLENLKLYGSLPTIDALHGVSYDESVHEHILAGNVVGEHSLLCKRPHSCTVSAQITSTIYIVGKEFIEIAKEISPDPVNGLECRMWKTVCIRVASALLLTVPAYQKMTYDQINFLLQKSFVPDLSNFKVFVMNELISDIVLVEGIAIDFNTHMKYIAPLLIPRTVQKLVIPKENVVVPTRFLIVPAYEVDEYDIMITAQELCELVSNDPSKCIRHSRTKFRRRRPKITKSGAGRSNKSSISSSVSIHTLAKSRLILTSSHDYFHDSAKDVDYPSRSSKGSIESTPSIQSYAFHIPDNKK